MYVPVQVVPCSLLGRRYSSFKVKPLYTVRVIPTDFSLSVCDSFEMLGLLLLDSFVSVFAIFGLQVSQ